jgi:hypothetical protein
MGFINVNEEFINANGDSRQAAEGIDLYIGGDILNGRHHLHRLRVKVRFFHPRSRHLPGRPLPSSATGLFLRPRLTCSLFPPLLGPHLVYIPVQLCSVSCRKCMLCDCVEMSILDSADSRNPLAVTEHVEELYEFYRDNDVILCVFIHA